MIDPVFRGSWPAALFGFGVGMVTMLVIITAAVVILSFRWRAAELVREGEARAGRHAAAPAESAAAGRRRRARHHRGA